MSDVVVTKAMIEAGFAQVQGLASGAGYGMYFGMAPADKIRDGLYYVYKAMAEKAPQPKPEPVPVLPPVPGK